MAKSTSRSIYIDQSSAEMALQKLTGQMVKLENAIAKGNKAGKDMTAEISKLSETKNKITEVQVAIDKGLKPSMILVQQQVAKLRNELKRMSEDAPGYAAKFEEFRKASLHLGEMQLKFQQVGKAQNTFWNEVKKVSLGVVIGNTVQAGLASLSSYVSGIVTGNAKLSDSLSDIEKATGLSAKAVAQLNSELGKIDTRTSTADLREIAVGLGQIGEAANKSNVAAIDQIVVALGDEFGGGAKQITTTLSVLRNNLSDIKTGNYADDVTHIGNALNVLGAEGLATAPVVTDIANRIAGIGRTFKLSSGEILGTAATFQELGIETERGSTAITKMFQKIGAEPEKFAKVAGIGVAQFKDLVNRDMLGAFTAVAQGAQKAGANNIEFSKIIKELDADGSGAGEVISKMGVHIGMLNQKVLTASIALRENNSIVEEFNKKNNNLAANLEKLGKAFNSLVTSKTLADFFNSAVVGLLHFVNALKAAPAWIKENQKALYLITAGIVLLNAEYIKSGALIVKDSALKLYNAAVTKSSATWTNVAAASEMAYATVKSLLTGKITLATAATQLWGVALKSALGPIGWVAIAIGAIVVAFNSFNKEATIAEKVSKDLADINAQAAKSYIEEKTSLESLLKIARDETQSKENRAQAIKNINAISPEYLGNITLENVNTKATTEAVANYIESLQKKALAQAYNNKLQELANVQLEIMNSNLEEHVSFWESAWNAIKTGGNVAAAASAQMETALKNRNKKLKDLEEQRKNLQANFQKDLADGKVSLGGTNNSNKSPEPPTKPPTNPPPSSPKKEPKEKVDDTIKKATEELERLRAEMRKLEQELGLEGLSKYQAELQKLEDVYADLANRLLENKAATDIDFLALEANKNKALKQLNERFQTEVADFIKQRNAANTADTRTQFEKDRDAINTEFDKKVTQYVGNTELLKQLADQRARELAAIEAKLESGGYLEEMPTPTTTDTVEKKWTDKAQDYLDYAKEVYSITEMLMTASNARDNADFERFKKENDVKKKAVTELAKNKTISEVEARRRIAEIDKENERKKEEIDKKQFQRNKALQLVNAGINYAQGIVSAYASAAPGLTNIATAAPTAALLAKTLSILTIQFVAQSAFIAAQQFAQGGKALPNGKIRERQNIPTQSNGDNILATVRTGEVILNERQQAALGGASTFAAIGVPGFATGGPIVKPFWNNRPYKSIDYGAVTQRQQIIYQYATGGLAGGKANVSSSSTPFVVQQNERLEQMLDMLIFRLDNPIAPNVQVTSEISLKKIQDAQTLENTIINQSKGL